MPTFEITSPDGHVYHVEGPDGATAQDALAQVQAQHGQTQTEQPPAAQPVANDAWSRAKRGAMAGAAPILSTISQGVTGGIGAAEAAGQALTGMAAFPVQAGASLYGLVTGAPGDRVRAANRNMQAVNSAMVYQPQTPAGQGISQGAGAVFGAPQRVGDYLGNKVTDATGSAGLGAATTLGVQSIPIVAGAYMASRNAAATRAGSVTPSVTPEERAQTYVADRTGLDWNKLSSDFKAKLTQVAQDATSLDNLDPAAVERQGRLESLRIPATRGQLTRNPVDLRNEGNVSATEAGAPIRDVYVRQNKAIIDNLNVLKGETGGAATTPEQVGMSVQDAALRAKAKASVANYDKLYATARATEPLATVPAAPFYDYLKSNPEVQHLGFLQSWFNKGQIGEESGITLRELADLRTKANGIYSTGGTDGYYAGQIVRAIDSSMEDVPAGASAWKAANAAFKAHKTEFADQGAVEQLVTNSSRTDRSVALENTWRKTVLGGSIQDLRNVKSSLLTANDPQILANGTQAWNDLRSQTIQHIIDESTKSVTRFEDGTPNVTPAAMERALKSVGPEKLNEMFGQDTVGKLRQIMESTRDIKTEPPTGFKGSPTFANTIAFLEKRIGFIPGHGIVTGAVRAVGALKAMGDNSRAVTNALADPTAQAAEAAQANTLSASRSNALMKYGTAAGIAAAERKR